MKRFVLFSLLSWSLFSTASAQMEGEQNPNTGVASYTYAYESEFLIVGPSWVVVGGTVLNSSVSGTIYTANIKFNTPGPGSVKLKSGVNFTIATLNVTIGCSGGATSGPTEFYGTASGQINLTGNSGSILGWQKKISGGSWTDISGTASATSYAFSLLSETTEYRAVSGGGTCSTVYSTATMVTVKPINFEGVITGTAKVIGNTNNGTIQIIGGTGTVQQWQYSEDGYQWTTISSTLNSLDFTNLTASRYYRARVTKGGVISYTPDHLVSWYPLGTANLASQNYVKQENIRVKETNPLNISALSSAQKTSGLVFMDGLDRPVQNVVKASSQSQKDIVSFSRYNSLGLSPESRLPFTAVGNDFYTGLETAQLQFYNGSTAKVATDNLPYSVTVFEASPLQRVLEQGAPGADWQPGQHSVKNTLRTNSASEIRIWKSDLTSPGYFAAGVLAVSEVTDENNNKVLSFADKTGRLHQKHVQVDAATWLKTLYIYDDIGRLKYTLQPEGVRQLAAATTISGSLVNQYAFTYVYDSRSRLIEKKVPGAAPLYYCYDPLDRLTLMQDGNIRTQNKWFYVKYDSKNRPVIQGIYINATQTTRAAVQGLLDALVYSTGSTYYEKKLNGGTHGYTNVSFPTTGTTPLAINYYDDYDLDVSGTPDFSYTAQGISGEGVQQVTTNKLTASKVLVMGTSTWLTSYVFYDKYGQTIQVRSNNYLSSTIDNLVTNIFNFDGSLNLSKAYHKAITGQEVTVAQRYEYDHAGRLKKVFHKINSATEITAGFYEYNELGQLVDKKLHSTDGTSYLQSIDYRYSIRGWLTSINNSQLTSDAVTNDETNDYFGMELLYNALESGLSNTQYYNGNISAIKWKGTGATTGAADQKSYKYVYDKSDRLTSATYQVRSTTAWDKEANAQNETMSYDHNGNISTLQRNQRKHQLSGIIASYVSDPIDNLTYTYASGKGNKLSKVEDAISGAIGFNNGVNQTTEYTYDSAGNLTADLNKTMSSVVYNELGKASQINFSDGRVINYTFDASGNKLKMAVTVSGVTTTTDYVNGFVYENNTMKFFGSPDGRVVKNGSSYEYQYSIADHQGNTRVVFSSAAPTVTAPTANFESGTNTNYQNYTNLFNVELFDHTDPANDGTDYSQKLTGGNGAQVGVARSMKVYPGDKVKIEAFAKYYNPSSTNSNLANFALALTGAFGVSSSSTGEALKAYNTLNNYGGIIAIGGGGGSGGYPKLFVNILLFDKDFKLLDAAWQQIDGGEQVGISPKAAHDYMMQEVTVKEAGYAYIYVSNENPTLVEFYVDDVVVTHTPSNVIQYNEYYPFGLQTSNSWTRENTLGNQHLYNAASELNSATNNYEMFFRGYDPILGRMMQVDPVASKYASHSPYSFAFNDPIFWNDPSGADPSDSFWNALDKLWNSENGGLWNQEGGYREFESSDEAFWAGARYNNLHNSWGYTEYGSEEASYAVFEQTKSFYGSSSDGRVLGTISGTNYYQLDRSSGIFYLPYSNTVANPFAELAAQRRKAAGERLLNGLQTTLDGAGLFPGLGEIADGANALIYLARGDKLNAGLSAAAMIPFAGWAATGAKFGRKAIVIGEGMYRVKDAARTVDAKWYQAWSKNFPKDGSLMSADELAAALQRNERWLNSKINEGYKIYDIGIDATRSTRSPFYELERNIIEQLKYPVFKLP